MPYVDRLITPFPGTSGSITTRTLRKAEIVPATLMTMTASKLRRRERVIRHPPDIKSFVFISSTQI